MFHQLRRSFYEASQLRTTTTVVTLTLHPPLYKCFHKNPTNKQSQNQLIKPLINQLNKQTNKPQNKPQNKPNNYTITKNKTTQKRKYSHFQLEKKAKNSQKNKKSENPLIAKTRPNSQFKATNSY